MAYLLYEEVMSGKLYANIYAGFILLKKQAQVLKIEIECPPS